jgi:uncharacterized membrane protein
MSLSSLSATWSAAPAAATPAWAFGQERQSGVDGQPGLEWLLRRNCSITPSQMLGFYASLCVVSLGIAMLFLAHGAPYVLAFTAIELTAVGAALLIFARHASDRETLTLAGRSLRVEQHIGHRVECTDFVAEWLTVEPAAGQGSLVQLSGEGRTVRVGRFLRPELRPAFARELRRALRRPTTPVAEDKSVSP